MPVFGVNMYKALTGSNKKNSFSRQGLIVCHPWFVCKITGGIFMFKRRKNDNTLKKV